MSSSVVANGVLYLSNGTMLYALDATTGTPLWNYTVPNVLGFTSPTVVNGMVYAGMHDSSGYHVDAFHLPDPAH